MSDMFRFELYVLIIDNSQFQVKIVKKSLKSRGRADTAWDTGLGRRKSCAKPITLANICFA